MKVKIKNKKNSNIVKEIDSNLLGDYLATHEWEKVEKEEKKTSISSNKSNLNMNEEENK